MKISQIYDLVNQSTREVLGQDTVVSEDLSNVVDIGTAIFNANAVDKYVKSLVNHIGKVIFVNRVYKGSVPSVLMDGWEFGSVLEKIHTRLPNASENESWELEDGTSYDPNIFTKPTVVAKFFNKRVTFEIAMSFTELQVKQSFSNATQLNGFISMLYTSVENSMTVKLDNLIMKTINNMISETIYSEYQDEDKSTKSGVRSINILYLYNNTVNQGNEQLTADKAIYDKNFIRFASFVMKRTVDRMTKMSTLFNIGGQERFTPTDSMHFVLHSDFKASADVYLQSDTFHNEFVALPNAESVPFWQGSGTEYSFEDTSKIMVTDTSNHTQIITGILGVVFDRYALGVSNVDRRVTSNYNGRAEFYNNWFKYDAQYFNDLNENFVVFFIA